MKLTSWIKKSGGWILLFLAVTTFVEAHVVISNAGNPAYWPSGNVSYRFNTTASGDFTGGQDASGTVSDEFDPIRDGFAAWDAIGGLNLNITELASSASSNNSSDYINSIQWIRSGWTSLSFRPPTNALAVTLSSFNGSTGVILDADIYFNAVNFNWAVVDDASESLYIDVQNIATHEIGHLLGLDHSSVDLFETDDDLADATMFYASSMGETLRRDPGQDDINGIRSLYPASTPSAPVIDSIEELSADSFTAEYRVRGQNFTDSTGFIMTAGTVSYDDAVVRYRTIESSEEAVIEVNTYSLPSGTLNLVAFNSPSAKDSSPVEVTGYGLLSSNSSSSSGGGCSMTTDPVANASVGLGMLLFMAIAVTGLLRLVFAKKNSLGRSSSSLR